MLFKYKILLLVLLCFLTQIACSSQQLKPQHNWTHLELGAGNYGSDGHTQASLRKTVLMALDYVSDAPNFIQQLPEQESMLYDPEKQYAVLFWTLDRLVERFGDCGTFYINDLYEEYAKNAAKALRQHAALRGYTSIVVETVAGDYTKLDFKHKYNSIHLKNPEVSFYNSGLYLFVLDVGVPHLPELEKAEFMDKGVFYRKA